MLLINSNRLPTTHPMHRAAGVAEHYTAISAGLGLVQPASITHGLHLTTPVHRDQPGQQQRRSFD